MLRLFRKARKDPQQSLREALGDFELPVFPGILTAALERVRDEDASFADIGDLVASDPGLSVRMLKTVNSVAFALRHEVRNVHHAVSLLGRSQLESILISMAVSQALPSQSVKGFHSKRFWSTAARRAVAGRALAELIDPSHRSESFTACLLQDLAIPILAHRREPEYGELLECWHRGEEELPQLERQAYGWDHAGVGESLCQEWGFPELLSRSIGSHHEAFEEQTEEVALPAAGLVALLREVDEQTGIDRLVDAAQQHFGLEADCTVETLRSSFEAAEEFARMLG
ncbi:MAG: HDOD domain-containing protein [bacterium]|nr:HDOD domain-containing protein [bacterium]